MTEYVCNYALIRFLPYRDAGEFVNIGVALTCASLGYFDFQIEIRHTARITRFFPELSSAVYRLGAKSLRGELERLRRECGFQKGQSRLWAHDVSKEEWTRRLFADLVRPRESLFHLAAPGTLLTPNPENALKELYHNFVSRQWTRHLPTSEEDMQRRIAIWLKNWQHSINFKEDIIGDREQFFVTLPFVARMEHEGKSRVVKAMRPLDLNRERANDIYHHGDDLVRNIQRLNRLNFMEGEWLVPVKKPEKSTLRFHAAQDICHELESLGVKTADFQDLPRIRSFADFSENSPSKFNL